MNLKKKYNSYLQIIFLLIGFFYFCTHLITMNYKSSIDLFYSLLLFIFFLIILITNFISKPVFKAINTNIFFTLFIIFIFEFFLSLGIIKNRNITPFSEFFRTKPNQVIETLNYSPYFKFKPNTIVSSVNNRGNDFIYSWKTDQYGYKNNSLEFEYDFIALGDSFTEGMGVAINDTWPKILENISGKKIYNTGVQGYAPSQFNGTLNILRDKLNFNGIIIGHLPKIYVREKNYIDKPSVATGGIESIRRSNLQSRAKLAIPQLIRGLSIYFKNINKVKNYQDFINFYQAEFEEIKFIDEKNELKQNLNWQKLVESYSEIIDYCIRNKKRIILVSFPYRYEVYFSKQIMNLDMTQYYIEFNLLKEKFSKFKEVEFIDTFPALNQYVHDKKNADKLPYLIFDGHLSKHGNKIVAKKILNSLNN
tara:strand:- start:30190 stop:31452 length:1263 start_codon:yes stop_codon:yes gene_type:complete